jgi:hypothetical protein
MPPAAMPETTVHKDSHFCRREDKVCTAIQAGDGLLINRVPNTLLVKQASKPQFD